MALDHLSRQIRPHFVRPEAHQRVLVYLQGLMSDASRKNAWQVAEAMGEVAPYAIQHVLDRAKWDCDGVRDELRASVREALSSPNAVLVIDETGFLKKGGNRWESNGSTVARLDGLKIARSAFFWLTPVRVDTPWWIANCICPKAEQTTRSTAEKRMCQKG
jgi:DDE superfamily endonuclease